MAHFYGRLSGNRGEATRCGSKDSGITVTAESWSTVIVARQYRCPASVSDRAQIALETKHGRELLRVDFDAEAVNRYSHSGEVQRALSAIEDAFFNLNAAVRAEYEDARQAEREEQAAA